MALEDYRGALKQGQREYRACISGGRYPYLQVLDEVLRFAERQGEEDLGLVDIPVERIVGTKTEGRKCAFAANFMPLLEENSEFSAKWSGLADAHLSEGIREPVVAWEYMNRFYIQEGNKRVSVLKYFGAAAVPGVVKRVLPKRQDTPESKIYFEFLDFYRLTRLNCLWFSRPGRFRELALAVKGSEEPWSAEERAALSSAYAHFRRIFKDMGGGKLPGTTADAFLAYVRLYGLPAPAERGEAALRADLARSWNELAAFSIPQPVELELDPAVAHRSILSKLLTPKPDVLSALFLYERSPETSAWTRAHEEGRLAAAGELGGRVETRFEADVAPEAAAEAIRRGVEAGAGVVFTTSPKLLPACLKAAAEYPEVRFLNCTVYTPHPSIRTYYGRMFEVKFLAGLLAGAMTHTHQVGYIADYPIYGSIAAVNAFALGVRMTDPWARVHLEWRAKEQEGVWERLVGRGVDMLSGQDLPSPVDPWRAVGLYHVTGGVGRQVAWSEWNWGLFYRRILQGILDGEWKQPSTPKAINYWWGLSAGVVDFHYAPEAPADVLRLVELMKEEIISGRFRIFGGRLTAQGGTVIREAGELSPEEIVRMDWLAENVEGTIPGPEELSEEARTLCRIQGLRREEEL